MITVCAASGKGGAGKTSFSAALASTIVPDCISYDTQCIYADCDVDAANGAIALGATVEVREPYFAGPGFSIDPAACNGCGRCFTACRFGAVKPVRDAKEFRIIPELCERCGACVDRCPVMAIGTYEKQAGVLLESGTSRGNRLVHARLEPGEDTSGKLVNLVRRRAARLGAARLGEARLGAARLGAAGSVIIVDAPPGIGCPVIASLTGTDLVVIVVEASASGIRDAARLARLALSMERTCIAVLNKTGLDQKMDDQARSMLAEHGIPLVGEIPFDPGLRSAEETNQSWASIDCQSSPRIKAALNAIVSVISSLERKTEREKP
jgi:MinD superfamily P-loop ATPase